MPALEAKVVWSKGGWERRDYPTIMSGPVVRYTIGDHRRNKTEVSAGRDMVCINAIAISSEGFRTNVLDILQRAWRQHLHLKQGYGQPLGEL